MKKAIIGIIFLILTVTIVNINAGEIENQTTSLRDGFEKLGVDVVMDDIVRQMNAYTPLAMGKASILESLKYSNKTLTYKIVVDGRTTKIVRSNQGLLFKSKTRKSFVEYNCNRPENRMFLNNGITLKHNYYSEANEYMYSNVFTKKDCVR